MQSHKYRHFHSLDHAQCDSNALAFTHATRPLQVFLKPCSHMLINRYGQPSRRGPSRPLVMAGWQQGSLAVRADVAGSDCHSATLTPVVPVMPWLAPASRVKQASVTAGGLGCGQGRAHSGEVGPARAGLPAALAEAKHLAQRHLEAALGRHGARR